MDDVTDKITGAAIEVHKISGSGLLESIYELALCHEMELAGLKVDRQFVTDIQYKGIVVKGQRIDIVVNSEVVVEIKSQRRLLDVATSQVLSYLKTMNLKRGLLINFGQQELVDGIKRISL